MSPTATDCRLMRKIRQTEKIPLVLPGRYPLDFYGALSRGAGTGGFTEHARSRSAHHALRWRHLGTRDSRMIPVDGVDDQDYDLAQNAAIPTNRLQSTRYPADRSYGIHAAPTKTLAIVGGSFCWKPLWLYDREKIFKQIRFYLLLPQLSEDISRKFRPGTRRYRPHRLATRYFWSRAPSCLEINVATMNQGINEHYTAFLNDGLQHIDAEGHCH